MANQGYTHATMQEIAAVAGVSKGLIYNYFLNKEMLLRGILEESLREMTEVMGDVYTAGLTREKFIRIMDETFRKYSEESSYWSLYISLMMQPEPKRMVLDMMRGHEASYFAPWNEYYRQKGHPDPEAMTLAVHALFDGIMINHINHPTLFSLERLRAILLEFFI